MTIKFTYYNRNIGLFNCFTVYNVLEYSYNEERSEHSIKTSDSKVVVVDGWDAMEVFDE